eukprot:1148576-Pelagomonas_calceolata.AAC.5
MTDAFQGVWDIHQVSSVKMPGLTPKTRGVLASVYLDSSKVCPRVLGQGPCQAGMGHCHSRDTVMATWCHVGWMESWIGKG